MDRRLLSSQSQTLLKSSFTPTHPGLLQRKCAYGKSAGLTGVCSECQRKTLLLQGHSAAQTDPDKVPPIVHEVLNSPGQPLNSDTQSLMESRLGNDFSQVRIHNDTKAAESAQATHALAYTVGRHIVFGAEQYAPATYEGQKLLTHELVHVVQQGAETRAASAGFSQPTVQNSSAVDEPLEWEANALANQLYAGDASPPQLQVDGTRLQKAPVPDDSSSPNLINQLGVSTLPYAEATELAECIRIMGEKNSKFCRQEVLGEAPPALVPQTSTPQIQGAVISPDGSQTIQVGTVTVIIKPDLFGATDIKAPAKAETRPKIETNLSNFDYRVTWNKDKVETFRRPPSQVTLSIQTRYAIGASPNLPSGYGRGTTDPDDPGKKTGNTSLGFHEGQHGLDYIEFLRKNPFPLFQGKKGITKSEFEQKVSDWEKAVKDFGQAMDKFALERGDCVGITIDEYMKKINPKWDPVCPSTPAPAVKPSPSP